MGIREYKSVKAVRMGTGRPTKYKDSYCEDVFKLTLLGATIDEIANFFGVNQDTIHEWKKVHARFSEAIKEGKIKADADVSKSLYKRANGYEYEEVHEEVRDGKVISKRVIRKQMPPDVAAANIWLKNRRGRVNPEDGQKWADRHEVEQKQVNINIDYSEMTIEELEEKLNDLKNKTD